MSSIKLAVSFNSKEASYDVISGSLKKVKENLEKKNDLNFNNSVAKIFEKEKFFDVSNRTEHELLKQLCSKYKYTYALYSSFEPIDKENKIYKFALIINGEKEKISEFIESLYREYDRQIRKLKAEERRKRRKAAKV